MEGGGLLFCWWGGEEGLGVGREVVAAVWGVEAFRKDNYFGAGLGSF
jgi:hypothetical protein